MGVIYFAIFVAIIWAFRSWRLDRKDRKNGNQDKNISGGNDSLLFGDYADKIAQDIAKKNREAELRKDIFASKESWELYKNDFCELNKSQQEYEIKYLTRKLQSKREYKEKEDVRDKIDELIRELELIYRA